MSGKPVYFIGPWDLNRDLACVPDDPSAGSVLLVESIAKGQAMPYHRKKLVMVLSALNHFAQELREDGYDVTVLNAPTYVEGIRRHVAARGATEVIAMQPREWGMTQAMRAADKEGTFGVPLKMHDDGGQGGHFMLPRQDFEAWAKGRKQLRMDVFYRWMRKRTGMLMAQGKPVGGKYSYDADNRKPPSSARPPATPQHAPDAITREVMARVARWPGHWGEVDGFDWAVTREEALADLEDFIAQRATRFGDFQDAMIVGEPWMWHARLSTAMNLSLISPQEVAQRALDAYHQGHMPLNAAEGFIRQVIGWREFIRGVYWRQMPGLRDANKLDAHRPLPDFFWQPEKTDMTCLRESISAVQQHGYAHHIQRLMVLGNFAMLAGISPLEISHWFWAGFVDAYEWVELPNVHGMAIYADDTFTTKPYAASASYINRMSDYCKNCRYQHTKRIGEKACPFNALYWRFMVKHREMIETNPRLSRLFGNWDRWGEEKQAPILAQAERFLDSLAPAEHGWQFHDDAC